MDELLRYFFDLLPEDATPKVIILFIFFASFLYALSKANIIYDFIDKFNNRELSRLKELLADENISEKAKITLKDKIDLIAYQEITGIKINNIDLQNQIIQHFKLAKGRLKYSDFKRAALFLQIKKNDIFEVRKPYWHEKIAYIYFSLLSIFAFILFSFSLFILVYYSMPIRLKTAFLILTIGLGIMLFRIHISSIITTCC